MPGGCPPGSGEGRRRSERRVRVRLGPCRRPPADGPLPMAPGRCGVLRRPRVTAWVRRFPQTGPCGVLRRPLVTAWVRRFPRRPGYDPGVCADRATGPAVRSRPLPRKRFGVRITRWCAPVPPWDGLCKRPSRPWAGAACWPGGRTCWGPADGPGRCGVLRRSPVTGCVRRIPQAGRRGVPRRSSATGCVRRVPDRPTACPPESVRPTHSLVRQSPPAAVPTLASVRSATSCWPGCRTPGGSAAVGARGIGCGSRLRRG